MLHTSRVPLSVPPHVNMDAVVGPWMRNGYRITAIAGDSRNLIARKTFRIRGFS